MSITERLIDEIMAASRIPSEKRRREVLRELRAHVEDFVSAGRRSGRSEEEIERLLVERFGDPRQIAQQFAWVYRRERAALNLGGFLISTVVVSLVILAGTISMQAGIMIGFGAPVVFGSRHTAVMALDILASAAAYLGLLSLGRFFERPLAVLAVVAAALVAVFVAAGLPPQYILFGFANGALLRGIQVAVRHPALRLGGALACFGVLGAVFFHPSPSALVASAASWLIMGSAYHLMTHVAARVDRALLGSM
jgi:HAAS domain-containing protein